MELKYIDNESLYQNISSQNRPDILNTTRFLNEHDVPLIKFRPFEDINFIEHGFSTRLGGCSSGIYKSMNLSFNLDDDKENVLKNFHTIAKAIDISVDNMVYSKQTHTTNVLKVGHEKCGMGIVRQRDYDNIDGLVTNEPGVCLVTSFADCVPLFFVDKVNKCIGSSHSGWRGTVGNIAKNTLELMKKEYGTRAENVAAFIGPSICMNCYEVSEDVIEQYNKAFSKEELKDIVSAGKEKGKYLLNLQMANYYNMINAGIVPQNIGISDICTCCNSDILFSHRASHGKRGILCGFIYIK